MALTVAVTGPTGEIGKAVVRALEAEPRIGRILGMARRPFRGPRAKLEYRQGDVLDRAAVAGLVEDADVVVHLAFVIRGSASEPVNLTGSRNVFEASAGRRLVHASSLAAYGYHSGNPVPITEDVPARGSAEHYYSRQKAACEALLAGRADTYVVRPCVVAGPEANLLLRSLLPGPLRAAIRRVPLARPVLPDPGVPFQLVHHDDVASAVAACAVGAGPPGAYNLAGDGVVTMTDLAHAVGGIAVPIPRTTVDLASALVRALPWKPDDAEWIHAVRQPMIMDTAKARKLLGWTPAHSAQECLQAMATSI